jgi:tetratricopeptide (TPR) repeat protein
MKEINIINIYAAFSKLNTKINIRTLLSLGILISFFLPWIKLEWRDDCRFGYDILLDLFKLFEYFIYEFFFVIIFAYLTIGVSVYNINRDLLQIKKTIFLNEFILGLILSILFGLFVFFDIYEGVVSFGIYSIAILSILGIIYTYGKSFFSYILLQKGMLYQKSGNYSEAFIYFYEATKQNDTGACNRLGELYEKGLGVEKNINTALEWYEKAATLGNEEAKMRMEIFKMYNNMSENYQSQNGNPVFIVQDRKSNGAGIAGFVLALLGVFLCWAPILNWILCITGVVLSVIGCSRKPKTLAITGVIISVIGFIFTIAVTNYYHNL